MKGKDLIGIAVIILGSVCICSCAKQEVSSTNKSESAKTTEINSVSPKTSPKTSVDEKKAPQSKDGIVFDNEAPHKTTQSENDKMLSDLTNELSKSKLEKFPDTFVICTVNNIPITFADYRHQFKDEEQQMQATLTVNPQVTNNLLQLAREKGVSLSLEERKHLIESGTKMQAGGAKGFNKMLAENHLTKAQFQDQVMDVGLAFKTANLIIESGLLNELVNRGLLSQAAKENGFSKDALKKYDDVSRSSEYKRVLAVSGISPNDLQKEIINNELCLKQIEKIKNESPLTDAEISNYYEKNRGKFRHGARIRLSQIFISHGDKVGETPDALKAKLKKENPKLSDADIKNQIEELEKKKSQLAKDMLDRTRKGEDFTTLANQYSEDVPKDNQKNGGDLGFQEESKLDKMLLSKIVKIPVGGIIPEVITSPYGFHIFKLTDKESAGYYKLSEIKDILKNLLTEEKSQQVVDDWLANARQKATIVISPDLKNMIASKKLAKR